MKDPATSSGAERQAPGAVSIAFLGPVGTFSEEALFTQPDFASAEVVACATLPEVLAAVGDGSVDFGFAPIENSIEGTINATIDSLVFDVELLIQREVVLDVHMNLVAPAGTSLASIRHVLSFPPATAQCRGFLSERLPTVEIRPTNSTAEAAQVLGHNRKPHTAAIAPRLAADLYGLQVIEAEIEDHSDNQTRFVVLARDGVPTPTGHDKTSLVCFQQEDRPGTLHAILSEFAARSINLMKIESRPTKRGLGEYCFIIDLAGHIADEVVADCLKVLHAELAGVKFLGSYPTGGSVGDVVREELRAAWRHADAWMEGLRSQIRPS